MSEVYGQANRYGKDIRDMSDFRSGIDDDLGMGENESTAVAHDDSREPITLDWWRSLIRPSDHPVEVDESGVYMILEGGELNFPGCKTRGDMRDLCRQLGVELKLSPQLYVK